MTDKTIEAEATPAQAVKTIVEGVTGTLAGEVDITIDYAIIEHFSNHLYSSPHKAIEELVSNSFDALATAAYVYVDGPQVTDRVVVWDDGISMDVESLKKLWWIAKSPKAGGDRVAGDARVAPRRLIGKFGIGKVATYQLGRRLSHLCRIAGAFHLVTVDYRDLLPEKLEDADPHLKVSETAGIVNLDEEAARRWAEAQFVGPADAFDELWSRESWTLAVVDELREERIPPGRLAWVLGNSMPLRPDFRVLVNDQPVAPKLLKGAQVNWDLTATEVVSSLEAAWGRASKAGRATGTYEEGIKVEVAGTEVTGVRFPNLGDVAGDVSIFNNSLAGDTDTPRSYGFFVMVRGRLINPDDELLLLPDPSYGTFYRAQFVIHADALDQDLLADRERIRRGTPRAAELAVLQEAMYLAARNKVQALEELAALEQRSDFMLPIASRDFYRDPLTALLVRHGGSGFDVATAQIERRNLPPEDGIAVLEPDEASFFVNATHPFFQAVAKRLGGGKKAREALRALDLLAVSELLLEGYLFDRGMAPEQVERIIDWRDGLLRQMAKRYAAAPEAVIEEVVETSYAPGKPFEDALAKLFGLMGFDASRDGRPDVKDVLVIAPTGPGQQRFTIEAKGSSGTISNDEAEVDIAARHRDAVGASHAIIVARSFAGFARRGDEAAVLGQCHSTKGASIVTVDVLIELYKAMQRFFYPLEMILPVLAEIETPADKLARVGALLNPLDQFDYVAVLNAIWQRQRGEASGDLVPIRAIWQEGWKDAMPFDEFKNKLTALEVLARGLLQLRLDAENATLRQSPTIVADTIKDSLEGQQGDGAAPDPNGTP